MALAKKAKKRTKKPAAPSAEQRKLDGMSPEDMLKNLPAASNEHDTEVRDLGFRIIAMIEKSGYHPTVALDTLQTLLTEGIGILLGPDHRVLWEGYVHKYHEESRLLSIVEVFRELRRGKTDTDKAEDS